MVHLRGYVITWNTVDEDGRSFCAGSVVDPAAVIGSVVSSDLNYHRPVGTVVSVVTDQVGLLVEIEASEDAPTVLGARLEGVFCIRTSRGSAGGGNEVTQAFLLHVSLTSPAAAPATGRTVDAGPWTSASALTA